MARFEKPTARQERGYAKWGKSRPEPVRSMAERFEPWSLYRLKSTGERVVVTSFLDDGTLTVVVSGRFNRVIFERSVFGIDPDDLEPCDLPGPHEVVGSELSHNEVADNIDAIRVAVRPDLWFMGPDGKAVRKQ